MGGKESHLTDNGQDIRGSTKDILVPDTNKTNNDIGIVDDVT